MKTPKSLVICLTIFLIITITPLYYCLQALPWPDPPSTSSPPPSPPLKSSSGVLPKDCDLFKGDWVPDPEAPYYTNMTCSIIDDHQDCMKHGRPDTEFMRWRWKPEGCELPLFDPYLFLDIVRNKSMVFVGDSVARNHMQSMMCLLSRVAHPVALEKTGSYFYPNYNFTVENVWSTFLVKVESTGPDENLDGAVHLHLDKPDAKWTANVESFDYVILSAGQWFFRPSYFYMEDNVIGCHRCSDSNLALAGPYFGYRHAFRSAFSYLNGLADYKGVTFLRTFSPSHYENGEWNNGGDCVRRSPGRRNETMLDGSQYLMRMAQVEEFEFGKAVGEKRALEYYLLDMTAPMNLRPDGHPSKYGHLVNGNTTIRDCVHWCMPGPVDSWSDIMLEILRRRGLKTIESEVN